MRISIFLSVSTLWNKDQEKFLERLKTDLIERGFEPRTLGKDDYDVVTPLAGCRRLMLECNGLITVAFRRNKIVKGISRPGKDDDLDGKWLTSSYCQIEPAMAYQLGLPILAFVEDGVLTQGVLEQGALGHIVPTFNLERKNPEDYFSSAEYRIQIDKWGHNVRTVWDNKGKIDRY